MKVIIREANYNDYEQISKLVKEVHGLHVKERPNDYKNCEKPLKNNDYTNMLQNKGIKIFVAEENKNKIVGYTILKEFEIKDHPIMIDKRIVHMEDLCVTKKYRRKGIGKTLYQSVKKYCKEIGIDNLELNVWQFNENAIKFYKSLDMREKFIRFETNI